MTSDKKLKYCMLSFLIIVAMIGLSVATTSLDPWMARNFGTGDIVHSIDGNANNNVFVAQTAWNLPDSIVVSAERGGIDLGALGGIPYVVPDSSLRTTDPLYLEMGAHYGGPAINSTSGDGNLPPCLRGL